MHDILIFWSIIYAIISYLGLGLWLGFVQFAVYGCAKGNSMINVQHIYYCDMVN